MTVDESSQDSFYIPPTAGPGAKEQKKLEKKPGEDWTGLVVVVAGVIILLAGFQLFIIAMQLINTWIADQLAPFVTAAFDIIVIAAGIWLIWKFSQIK